MIVAAAQNEYGSLFVWSLVLIGVVIAGFVLVAWVKRRLKQPDTGPTLGFSLADLRELHRTGKISDEEYERARGKMAASLKKRESSEKPKKAD
jgi:uncharacterized membrane protein